MTENTVEMTDYVYSYKKVPSDPEENALWREKTLDYCSRDHPDAIELQKMIMERCRKDFWFWSMGFCFVHEPRILDDDAEDLDTKVPFIPWPHQIPVVDRILKVLGKRDLRIVKSRAQGASWILVLIFIWCWLFKRGFNGNLVSKDEVSVDRRDDMNSLMGKCDKLISWLPVWMVGVKNKQWRRNYSEHYLTRMDGETAITGYACTGDVASGGRATAFALDEHAKHPRGPDREAMAATQPISRCRLFISTPKGKGGAYAEIIHDDTIEEPVLYLSWRDNPTQNRGLYRVVKGKPVAIDEEKYGLLFPEYRNHEQWIKLKERLNERGYDLTSSDTRSPWYDQEGLRPGANPVLVAQEYDMAFGAEGSQYFAEQLINRLKNSVRRPLRGELHINPESLTGTWSENPDGRFKLWCEVDIRGNPPMGEYVVGCDVSSGIGGSMTSNSAISVFNRRTGEKVASFASPSVIPYELAEVAIAICRWFVNYKGDPAFLIWEANGYGGEFTKRVERSTFKYYYRRKTKDSPLHSRHTDKAGYWTYKRSYLLGPYREALLEGYFDNPEREAVEELREYQMGADGEPYHVGETNKDDPAGAKGAHGDRCLISGTMILTDCGEKPIEQLAPGDMVWTRDGLRAVRVCGETGFEPVFRMALSNGRTLTGTGNHPVWTKNRSWVSLQSLCTCDTLLAYQNPEVKSCQQNQFEAECISAIPAQRPLYSTGGSTTATLTPSKNIDGGISGAGENMEMVRKLHFMLPFGNTIMGLFQRGITYITRMATSLITTFPTLNALLYLSTQRYTKTAAICGSTCIQSCTPTSACIAETSIRHFGSTGLSFAVQPAVKGIGGKTDLAMKHGRALSAAPNTAPTSTEEPRHALESAEAVCVRTIEKLEKPARVYNLSVAKTPEYFAQGVLVHNCIADSLTWEASVNFGDHFDSGHNRKNVDVMNVKEDDVARESFAWRRAQYLKMLGKQKQKSTW